MDEMRLWQGMLFDKGHWIEFCWGRGVDWLTALEMWEILEPAPKMRKENV